MDAVKKPKHYQGRLGLEAIEVMKNFMTEEMLEGYLVGGAMKYLMRYREKNGTEDLKKARQCIAMWLEHQGESPEIDAIVPKFNYEVKR